MMALVIEQRARLDLLVLVVDGFPEDELVSVTTTDRLEVGFLPLVEPELELVTTLDRVECRRDKPSFGLSVPLVLADRAEDIEVWLV